MSTFGEQLAEHAAFLRDEIERFKRDLRKAQDRLTQLQDERDQLRLRCEEVFRERSSLWNALGFLEGTARSFLKSARICGVAPESCDAMAAALSDLERTFPRLKERAS